jgi:hypothetical protein
MALDRLGKVVYDDDLTRVFWAQLGCDVLIRCLADGFTRVYKTFGSLPVRTKQVFFRMYLEKL